jgi:hypothetical protein
MSPCRRGGISVIGGLGVTEGVTDIEGRVGRFLEGSRGDKEVEGEMRLEGRCGELESEPVS